ncbi:hypothetical protein AYI70_g3020 [Smittium culicis]|uniref:Reverse transcriptase zinc-binding domain-containing protein n=1 Tax=Smittium culicis TaxID=133412 RepID=A0A1R1Y691_9FUNG|nr:hypothetical protein AYI70_g12170 [Smittium culicis]OMJ07497.1 hypothetical protein AYI70_g12142 [Smittium culicis]OMJ22226.1 hypothetical protein AYI70_g3020 [Smittium culicis]
MNEFRPVKRRRARQNEHANFTTNFRPIKQVNGGAAMYAGYYLLNRSDVLTELKVRFINSVLLPIGCYGGETFGMSENRCRPIQTVIDQATCMIAKFGKNAAMERIREELGISSVFLRTSTARERALIKWPASKTWIADLINQPIKAQKSTWVTGCSRWIKKYCTKNATGQTVISLANRKAKNSKSKIQHWAISRNIKNKGNWIGLTAQHPTLRLGLQDVGRMRMGSYWTAQRMANAKIIDRKYKNFCPFCSLQKPETVDHILLDCALWRRSGNSLGGGESKQSYIQLRAGTAGPNFELETEKFLDGIRVARSLIFQDIGA